MYRHLGKKRETVTCRELHFCNLFYHKIWSFNKLDTAQWMFPKCVLHKFFLLRFLFLKSQEQTPKCSPDTLKTTSVLQINSSDKDILGPLKLPVAMLFSEGPAEKPAGLCTNQLHSLSNHGFACLGLLSGVIPSAFVSSHYVFTGDRVAHAMERVGVEVKG